MDPIERTTYQIVSDCTTIEVPEVMNQLREFISPDMRIMFDGKEAREQVLTYVRKQIMDTSITINLMVFKIIVTIVPGKSIDVYIQRKNVSSEERLPLEHVYESRKI